MKFIKLMLATAVLISNLAWADAPIQLIVPAPAGGVAGNLAHLVAELLTEKGLTTMVDHKPGADGVIGANHATEAQPDGKTLFLGAGSNQAANMVGNPPGMKYTEKSFVPLVPLGEVGQVLIVGPNSPFKNYEQFKFYVRRNPDKFFVGFWHNTYSKLIYAWADSEGLPKPTVILYKGAVAMELAVMSGDILAAVDPWTTPKVLYAGGKINVIAGFTDEVVDQIKEVDPKNPSISVVKNRPNLAFPVWYGLYAPAGTPKDVTDRITKVVNQALKEPKWQDKMNRMLLKNYGGSTDKLERWRQRDIANLRKYADYGTANSK